MSTESPNNKEKQESKVLRIADKLNHYIPNAQAIKYPCYYLIKRREN